MDIPKFLSNIFLFESLSDKQIELIEDSTAIKKIRKGEHLFSEGQSSSAFFIVVSGRVKIYKLSSDGNEHILHIQLPGDLVAEAIIFDMSTYPAYCQALEDSVLLRIAKAEFLHLLQHCPEITFKVLSAYSRRLRQLLSVIEELSLHDVKSRLANYLVRNSKIINGKNVCPLTISKKDLAAILGTIPETLSRTLQFFKKEKIITEEKESIIILSPDSLRKNIL